MCVFIYLLPKMLVIFSEPLVAAGARGSERGIFSSVMLWTMARPGRERGEEQTLADIAARCAGQPDIVGDERRNRRHSRYPPVVSRRV
jgi:hypothetical protein